MSSDSIPKMILNPNQTGKEFRKTFEKMEGFSFVTPLTGLNELILEGKMVINDYKV
jgi:hypothetical protein